MNAPTINIKDQVSLSKIDELKSIGVRFKAKLMGNTSVEELRGKSVAEYAMAKLKLNIMKQKQHKTKVTISLKWDGFFVYLSEGGQELLHFFLLENISFVWKDPCDNRAFGIIFSDGSIEKQPLITRFYGYKTEKSALPLIMSLKELFGLRVNEDNDTNEVKNYSVDIKKEDERNNSEDLLDLKMDIPKTLETDNTLSTITTNVDTSKWTSFPNVDLFSIYSSNNKAMSNPRNSHGIYNDTTLNSIWNTTHQLNLQQYNNPFSQPTINSPQSNSNINYPNLFGQIITSHVINSAVQPLVNKSDHAKFSQNKVDDLFSDLLTTDYCLDTSKFPRQLSKNSLASNGKTSLLEIKNSQEINEPMDFSLFDKNTINVEIVNTKNKSKDSCAIPIPLFQID